MNARISSAPVLTEQERAALEAYQVLHAVAAVTRHAPSTEGAGKRIVLWDFGAKENIKRLSLIHI